MWNCRLVIPVFRDSTSTILLECISDITKYNPTLDRYVQLLCGCLSWSVLSRREIGHPNFSSAWSLGPLEILKIPPVEYSCQGSENLVSRSSCY